MTYSDFSCYVDTRSLQFFGNINKADCRPLNSTIRYLGLQIFMYSVHVRTILLCGTEEKKLWACWHQLHDAMFH